MHKGTFVSYGTNLVIFTAGLAFLLGVTAFAVAAYEKMIMYLLT